MSALPPARAEGVNRGRSAPPFVWAAYALMSVLLSVYVISLFLRSPVDRSLLVDVWPVASFELVAGALCILRAVSRRHGRTIPLIFGCGILAWTAGDFLQSAESIGGASPTTPSLADVFYLRFYPLAY